MFGQNNQPNDQIPEHTIQGALNSDDSSPATAAPAQSAWSHPGTPLSDSQTPPPVQPPQSVITPADTPAPPTLDLPVPSTGSSTGNDDLLDIKQKALTQLSPLVGHLDQSPEEKFRTTMMMIQASDDQKLIPQAYEAANAIQDEKAKAQALLDIVNEINYFTQHHQG